MLSTTVESPWFPFWKSGSLLDLSGSRMELSGEIGPGERRLIYSGLDPSAQWAEGTEATQGSHPRNIFLRTLKDRPNAPQPGQCFLSFISWPFSFPTIFSPCCIFFSPVTHPVIPGGMYDLIWVSLDSYCFETGEDISDWSRGNLIQDSWSLHHSTCQVKCVQRGFYLWSNNVFTIRRQRTAFHD